MLQRVLRSSSDDDVGARRVPGVLGRSAEPRPSALLAEWLRRVEGSRQLVTPLTLLLLALILVDAIDTEKHSQCDFGLSSAFGILVSSAEIIAAHWQTTSFTIIG